MHWGLRMTENKDDMARLDALFDLANAHPPAPSADLMARVAQDAQTGHRDRIASTKAPEPGGFLHQIYEALGGWPAFGGLATATCAGIWIGINPPDAMAQVAESYLGVETVSFVIDMSPETAFDLTEEPLP